MHTGSASALASCALVATGTPPLVVAVPLPEPGGIQMLPYLSPAGIFRAVARVETLP